MFGLPELDDVICQQLDQSDLAQCVRVNRQWYSIAIPHLWRVVIRNAKWHGKQTQAFCTMVLEDYLFERGHRQLQSEQEHDQTSSFLSLSTITRCGPYVRETKPPHDLFACFNLHIKPTGQANEPTTMELLHHFYQRCPALKVEGLTLEYKKPNVDEAWTRFIISILPRVHRLYIKISYRGPNPEFMELRNLLNRCSSMLTWLTLDINIACTEDGKNERVPEQEEAAAEEGIIDDWISLREVSLWRCIDNSGSNWFWSWLWKRFGRVEKLRVHKIHDIAQGLAEGMSNHMPNLRKIGFGTSNEGPANPSDAEIADLLQRSYQGWKEVVLDTTTPFGRSPAEALLKHTPTLEKLTMSPCYGLSSKDLVQVLASSPNLHTLIDTNVNAHWGDKYPRIKANVFIDRDPVTGLLKPWKCEASLKVLEIKITGIPRPDSTVETEKETYPGQGRDIQNQVYDRLARLTSLEGLWLGDRVDYDDGPYDDDPAFQCDCLELTLESGLHKLSGLKALRALNVSGMGMRIGAKEVQWMAEHWPKLHAIYGLEYNGPGREAIKWLWHNRPGIKAERWH